MNGIPLVSAVMAVHNEERHISSAIESILSQDFADFELVIVDDASTDGTPTILRDVASQDHRVNVVMNTTNQGMGRSFNRGVSVSRGRYIARMDGDDVALSGRFAGQVAALESDPGFAVVGGQLELIDEHGTWVGNRQYPLTDDALKRNILRFSPFAHPATMIRRAAIEEAGGYDQRYTPAEDLDLWCRLGRRWKFANLSDYVLRYRLHNRSMTARHSRRMQWQTLAVRWRAVTHYGYRPSAPDVVYSLAQLAALPIPYRHKMRLFEGYRKLAGAAVRVS